MIGIEIINDPAGQICVLQGKPGDLLRPAQEIQPEGLGGWSRAAGAFRGRHQVNPNLQANLARLGEEDLQIIPIRRRVPDQPVVGGGAQFLEPLDHQVDVHAAVGPAQFGIIVSQVLAADRWTWRGSARHAIGPRRGQEEDGEDGA